MNNIIRYTRRRVDSGDVPAESIELYLTELKLRHLDMSALADLILTTAVLGVVLIFTYLIEKS